MLKQIFNNIREWYLALINKNKKPKRYWDFSYANKFLNKYRNDIDYFELAMFKDRNYVSEVFIENGEVVKSFSAGYQQGTGEISGVKYTLIDIPSIHVYYKSGSEEWIACYIDYNFIEKYGYSHRKLT